MFSKLNDSEKKKVLELLAEIFTKEILRSMKREADDDREK